MSHFSTIADAIDAGAPECFSDEFAHHERHGTLPPSTWAQFDADERASRDAVDYPEPEPVGPEVIIPGPFLDAHEERPTDCPEPVAAFLTDARLWVTGRSPRAKVECPVDLLQPLADYAESRILAAEERPHPLAIRASHVLATHVRSIIRREEQARAEVAAAEADRLAPYACPEGDETACPTASCGCPPF